MSEYLAKLNSWKISGKQLDRLYVILTERHEYWPTIAELTGAAAEVGVAIKAPPVGSLDWIGFDLNGIRYVVRVNSWSNPPPVPAGAVNAHPMVARPAYDQCLSPTEGRKWFAKGYLEAGGDTAKLQSMFKMTLPDIPEDI